MAEDKPHRPVKEQSVWRAYELQSCKDSNDSPSNEVRLKGKDSVDSVVPLKDEDVIKIQLEKYKSHYERYQFYMDISLKVIVSYYLVTAAILSFYFGSPNNPYGKISVLLPIVLGFVWSGVFLYGARLWLNARRGILDLEKNLIDQRLIIPPPDFHLLLRLLFVFGLLFFIVAVSILLVWLRLMIYGS